MIFQSIPCPTHTPWGAIQDAHQDLPGIWWISTASHGGFIISPERRAAMPAAMREFEPFAGGNSYEEDDDWAVVILAFATQFTAAEIQTALRTVAAVAAFECVNATTRAQLQAVYHSYIAAVAAADSPNVNELLATREDARRALSNAGVTRASFTTLRAHSANCLAAPNTTGAARSVKAATRITAAS